MSKRIGKKIWRSDISLIREKTKKKAWEIYGLLLLGKKWMLLCIRKRRNYFMTQEKVGILLWFIKSIPFLILFFYYNPMREIEEGNGRIHGEWIQGRGREYFKHASRDE